MNIGPCTSCSALNTGARRIFRTSRFAVLRVPTSTSPGLHPGLHLPSFCARARYILAAYHCSQQKRVKPWLNLMHRLVSIIISLCPSRCTSLKSDGQPSKQLVQRHDLVVFIGSGSTLSPPNSGNGTFKRPSTYGIKGLRVYATSVILTNCPYHRARNALDA